MKIDKLLVFDMWGDYGHFRRGYTTTSALTYPFPPKSTLIGTIGGILGLPNEKENNNYYKLLKTENIKLSLRILNPIKKIIIKENLVNTKKEDNPLYFKYGLISRSKGRSQIPLEFIKAPSYRIYVWINNKYLERLKEFLEEHKSFYTPYFGITECIANFRLVKFFEKNEIVEIKSKNGVYEIDSVIPIPAVEGKIIIERNIPYGVIKTPLFINEKRETEDYCEFVYNEIGNPTDNRMPLKAEKISIDYASLTVSVGGENVILF